MLFGDESGRFVVTLLGLRDLKVSWKSAEGNSSFTGKLVVGCNHHVASSWQDGLQRYYLDGQLVHVDARPGPMDLRDGEGPAPIRLGPDLPGVDVTIGEPTIWVGHVLSPREVGDLARRDVRVGEVAPGSIASRWSLAGPDGSAARVGDAGLADSSGGKLDFVSIEGTAPAYRGSVLAAAAAATVGSVQVAPSGRSIVVAMLDATGALAPVQSLSSVDDLQVISITGTTGASTTLSFGGHTTASVPYALGPPATSLSLTAAIAPGTYVFHGSWPYQSLPQVTGSVTRDAVFRIFDDSTLLATINVDETVAPVGFVDPHYNQPAVWQPFGTFTIAGHSVTITVSAALGTGHDAFGVGGIRIEPQGNTDQGQVYYLNSNFSLGPNVPPNYGGTQYGTWTLRYNAPDSFYNAYYSGIASGSTPTVALSPTSVQAALAALPNVPANSVAVSALSTTSVLVHFTGSLANAWEPTIVASDPALTVSHDGSNGSFVGGQFPSISINGGVSIPLENPIWATAGNPQHYIVFPLPQSAPDSQLLSSSTGAFTVTNFSDGTWNQSHGDGFPGPGNLGFLTTSGASNSGTYPFQGLPPGTYRFAATWTAAAGNCPGATFAVKDGSGNTLGTATFDQTTAPADFNAGGASWKTIGSFTTTAFATNLSVVVSFGTATGHLVLDTVRVDRTGANTSVVVQPSDVVTFTAPAAFAVTTAGPAPAQTATSVTNRVGGTLLPAFSPTAKTMRVGYNIEGESFGNLVPVYANYAHRNNWSGNYVTVDTHGYPVSSSGPNTSMYLSLPTPDSQGLGKGLPNLEFGAYTVMWDGPATTSFSLIPSSSTTTVTENLAAASITGTTNNKRVFDVEDPYYFAPSLRALASSTAQNPDTTYSYTFTNLRIFPPGINPNNPPLFHPAQVAKAQGAGCLRFLDALGINGSGVVEFSDFGTIADSEYGGANRSASAAILSIGPDNATPRFCTPNVASFLVTTVTPHGFPDGATVNLHGTIGTVNLTPVGGTFVLDNAQGLVHVTSPTTFLFPIYVGNANLTMTNTLTPTGATASTSFNGNYYDGAMYFTDCIALCNQAGADMWVNIPMMASDACITEMATLIATNLNSGLKVHVEYCNECWNLGFPQWTFCVGKSQLLGGPTYGFTLYYVTQAVHIHNLFRAAFTAAGRAATDVRRVLGTQGNQSGITGYILANLTTLGATFDELAPATYFSGDPVLSSYSSLEATLDGLTVDQLLDLMEMSVQYGNIGEIISCHRPLLDAAGFNAVEIVTYEGGLCGVIPNGTTSSANHSQRNHAGLRHPRMYPIQLAYNQVLQDAGCSLFNHFFLAGGFGDLNTEIEYWSLYEAFNEPLGTGNATTDAANIATPEDIPALKSQRAGAIKAWQALVAPISPVKRYPLSRNGRLRARGFRAV